ncbi:hypothetical protein RhiirA1_448506 [Rhizophagus irregularis]|uniref:Uncharacterized protein n=1 Tax=Rhizophagus irregularis TaxID=588596 RepID=A0A2N0SJH8_9GLOM|nr:hypothetical protein RhiirA1_448506 [Rhizophagus irregularis]
MSRLNPDILILIFDKLQYDKKSLYSCILVNREWCRIVVPILWKVTWYNDEKSERKLFNTILFCLPISSKQLLIDNGVKLQLSLMTGQPLFKYISFCTFPNNSIVYKMIEMVLVDDYSSLKQMKRDLLKQEIFKLFVSQCKNIKKLDWDNTQPLSLFSGASTCFSSLRDLYVDVDFVKSDALYGMAQICKGIEKLTLHNCIQDVPGLVILIDVQRNLKSLSIHYEEFKGIDKELSKAMRKKAKTITELYLSPVNCVSPLILTSFIKLEKGLFYNYSNNEYDKEIEEFQRYMKILEFPDLQYLEIEHLSCFKELSLLIEKSKGNILEINIYTKNENAENAGLLIKTISRKCPKIEKLTTHLDLVGLKYLKELLINCNYLEYLRLDCLHPKAEKMGDEILDIIIKYSPFTLKEIHLSETWMFSVGGFERFFDSWKGRDPVDFEIIYNDYNNYSYITANHKNIIRKYVNEKVINFSNCF